jgi:hypothetical protein
VVLVASWSAVGVEPGGWEEFGVAVGAEPHVPVVVVDLPVMVPALCRPADYAAFRVEVVVVQVFCCLERGIIRTY